jgi:hypothetical protein
MRDEKKSRFRFALHLALKTLPCATALASDQLTSPTQ